MSPKLPRVSGRRVARVAERLGFAFDRQRGSHAVYYRADDRARVVIPMRGARPLKPKTLLGIIDDLRITVEEFREFL